MTKTMTDSLTVPTMTYSDEYKMNALVKLRK